MSQEEKKLIEEFYRTFGLTIQVDDLKKHKFFSIKAKAICNFFLPKINEAYRSGKLAGLKESDEIVKINQETKQILISFKSLIEEEKKKL